MGQAKRRRDAGLLPYTHTPTMNGPMCQGGRKDLVLAKGPGDETCPRCKHLLTAFYRWREEQEKTSQLRNEDTELARVEQMILERNRGARVIQTDRGIVVAMPPGDE